MNPDNNAPNPSNPPGTNQFEGISMVDSTFIPQRPNNRAQLGDNTDQGRGSASFGAGLGLQENALSEVRGRDSQIDQRDMSVAQIQQDVGRKLRMRIASDDFENKILQSADLGETIDMLKKLVREANLNGEAENDILDDLDNLKDNLSAAGIDVSDKGAGQLLIQKTFYETQLEIKRSEQEKIIDNDFELAQQMKKIGEDIELINDDIREQKRNSDREKGILEIKIAQLKNELQSLQTFEVSLNNLVKDMEDAKNQDGDENNRIKSEINRLKKEQERIVNSLKEARNQRKEAKEREYEASQEIEELQEKLNSLKDLEASLEEIMKQIEKIAVKIKEGEENIGEFNKKCKEAKKLYEEERRKFEQEKNSQDIQRKDLEKQKEDIERIVKENEEQESEKSPTSLADAAQRREEERALLEAKLKSAIETEKELNQKQERYSKWREDLQSRKDESRRLYDIKEELKQCIEEAKAIEGAYLNLEKEYQIQKQIQDEVVLNFQVQRKEKVKELNQKLEDAKNELNWKQKRRTGACANFCVAFINTGIVGLLVLAFLYVSKIDIPGIELV